MLGICVVYLVPDADSDCLLDLSVARLRATTSGPFRLYAAVARRSRPGTAARLREAGVELPPIERFHEGGTVEHAYLLDALVDHAVRDGCTHVVTFDMDSWPVVEGWDAQCRAELGPSVPVVAALRAEVHANFPFPGFTFMDGAFWEAGRSSFSVELRRRFADGILARIPRHTETGAGILAQLLEQGQEWVRLPRSNAWDPHRVMCGLYGNRIFHLGAGSREPAYESDRLEFGLNDSPLREGYRLAVNGARRAFLLGLLQEREHELLEQLRTEGPSVGDVIGLHAQVQRLEAELSRVRHRLEAVEASASWRLTEPVRALGRLLRRRL